MLSIDVLTIGNEFKDSDGKIYKVSSNFSQIKRLYVELELQDPELIKEQ